MSEMDKMDNKINISRIKPIDNSCLKIITVDDKEYYELEIESEIDDSQTIVHIRKCEECSVRSDKIKKMRMIVRTKAEVE